MFYKLILVDWKKRKYKPKVKQQSNNNIMAFGGPNKEQFKKFQDQVGSKLYLNGKDIDVKGVKIRVLPWIYKNSPIAILQHLEGWTHKQDGNKIVNKPVRFEIDEEIPETIEWNVGEFNGEPTTGFPKPALAFLCWVYGKGIRLASFNQVSFLRGMLGFFDEEDASYVDNITETDLVIKKDGETKNAKYVLNTPKSDAKIPQEAKDALEGLLFGFELYMQSQDPFNPDPKQNINWKEVETVLNGGEKKVTKKNVTKKVEPKKEEEVINWRPVTTPKGAILGEQTIDQLGAFKAALEKANKTDTPLYKTICYGIEHFEEEEKVETNLDESDVNI